MAWCRSLLVMSRMRPLLPLIGPGVTSSVLILYNLFSEKGF
jgi:hypothetical protein